mmetsp:Transcript_27891/g.64381  ORF Transcript_27891/g.64381 Transcript_27891/m.64381 type:complete len:442 (+) Transcript_27891:162-1487(+)
MARERAYVDAQLPACITNLNAFHDAGSRRIIADSGDGVNGHFTWVRPLLHAINGRVDQLQWHREDGTAPPVAVKRMDPALVRRNVREDPSEHPPEAARHSEDSLTEIGVYDMLARDQAASETYILKMLSCYEVTLNDLRTEMDEDIWEDTYGERDEHEFLPGNPIVALVLEFCSGGELMTRIVHGPGERPAQIPLPELRSYMSQLCEAVWHLHNNNIGHRDISLENILLKPVGVGAHSIAQLMDFGQACQLRAADGTPYRYFACVGKRVYRPPEAYIPPQTSWPVPARKPPGLHTMPQLEGMELFRPVQAYTNNGYCLQVMFPHAALDAPNGAYVAAWPAGYKVEQLDVFMIGMCLFLLHTRRLPWGRAMPRDEGFKTVVREHRGQLNGLIQKWATPGADVGMLPPRLARVLSKMTSLDPEQRGRMDEHRTQIIADETWAP